MAYKFQLGAAVLSGSVIQSSGSLSALATDVESLDIQDGGITNAGSIAGVTTVSGSGKFQMGSMALGGTDVSSTAGELNVLAGVTAGAGSASKALVLDSSSDVSGINALGLASLSASAELNADSVQIGGNTILTSDGNVTAVGVSGSGAFQAGGALTVAGNADLNGILDVASHVSGAGNLVLTANSSEIQFTRGGATQAKLYSTEANKLEIQGSNSSGAGVILKFGSSDALHINSNNVAAVKDLAIVSGGQSTVFLNTSRSQLTLTASAQIGIDADPNLITLTANTASIAGLLYATNIVADDASGFAGTGLVDNGGSLDVSGLTNSEIDANAAIDFSKLAALNSGRILVGNSSNKAASVAMSGHVAIDNLGATTIQNNTITSAMVSGTLAGDKIALNSNQFTSGGGQINLKSSISGALTFENDITLNGNLVVLGDTFSASVGTLLIEDAHINIGDGQNSFATGYGIEFGTSGSSWGSFVTVSGSDFGHSLSSSFGLLAPIVYGDTIAVGAEWTLSDTHISGGVPISASAFYGDGSNLTGITADTASSVVFGVGTLSSTGNISQKVTALDSISGAFTATLPALSGVTEGSLYILKDKKGNCGTNNVTIAANGSDTIDGVSSILLESDYAAVSLVVILDGSTKKWMIV